MKLLAIDGNSILNRAFYGVHPLTTKDGTYTNAIVGFLNILLKLEREIAPNAVAIAFDVSRKTFRNDQYADYKANRKGMPEELAQQFPLIKEILTLMGYTIVFCEGYEGDDVLGTLAFACANQTDCSCVIATGDRDCLQLVTDTVSVSLAKTKENILYTPQRVLEDFGVLPKEIIELKALMGDSSDNIPGVKGIGEKTAVTLIQENHSIDVIYENVEAITATPRVKKLLIDSKDNAFLSRQLATICCTVPIDHSFDSYVKKQPESQQLSELLTKLEMFSFIDKLSLHASLPIKEQTIDKIIKFTVIDNASLDEISKQLQTQKVIGILNTDEQLQLLMNQTIYLFNENKDEVLKQIGEKQFGVLTFKAKPLIKEIKKLGVDDVNLAFDVELAGYLLNPDSKGYDIKTLANHYLGTIEFAVDELYFEIACIAMLCERLKQELETQGMTKLFYDIELPLCEVLADMEFEGFAVDKNGLREFGERLDVELTLLKSQIYKFAGEEFNINSTKELGVILFEKLALPAKKKTKTGYSTNVDVLESLMGKHEIIPAIMEYRKLTKLHSTYVIGLLKVVGDDERVHSTFNQTETRTGRISSTEPNVQNIPIRTPIGSELRKFFVAREGYTLIDADYSQIELRILADIANDKNMIQAFINGDDIHSITASQVFNCPLDQMTSVIRSRAKAINFGIVYGIGAYSLSQDINVSVSEAKEYINAYLATYSGVAQYMHDIIEQAQKDGFVATLYGRKRDLADINATNKLVKAFAQRVALNAPIQGTAADIIKLAMNRVHARIKKEQLDARLILQVHDELIIEAPAMQASMIKAMLKEEMEHAASLSVPLIVDVHEGKNWYLAKG